MMDIPAQKERVEFALPLPFCSIRALSGLDKTHIGERGQSLLDLSTQMLISSGNILTDTSKNVLPAIWAFLSPVKLTHKIHHHNVLYK